MLRKIFPFLFLSTKEEEEEVLTYCPHSTWLDNPTLLSECGLTPIFMEEYRCTKCWKSIDYRKKKISHSE
jgi:hypothetical protein